MWECQWQGVRRHRAQKASRFLFPRTHRRPGWAPLSWSEVIWRNFCHWGWVWWAPSKTATGSEETHPGALWTPTQWLAVKIIMTITILPSYSSWIPPNQPTNHEFSSLMTMTTWTWLDKGQCKMERTRWQSRSRGKTEIGDSDGDDKDDDKDNDDEYRNYKIR